MELRDAISSEALASVHCKKFGVLPQQRPNLEHILTFYLKIENLYKCFAVRTLSAFLALLLLISSAHEITNISKKTSFSRTFYEIVYEHKTHPGVFLARQYSDIPDHLHTTRELLCLLHDVTFHLEMTLILE